MPRKKKSTPPPPSEFDPSPWEQAEFTRLTGYLLVEIRRVKLYRWSLKAIPPDASSADTVAVAKSRQGVFDKAVAALKERNS